MKERMKTMENLTLIINFTGYLKAVFRKIRSEI